MRFYAVLLSPGGAFYRGGCGRAGRGLFTGAGRGHRYGDTRHNLKTFPVRVTFFVVVRITLPGRCKEVSQKRAFSPGGRILCGVGGPFASRRLRYGLFARNSHASVAKGGGITVISGICGPGYVPAIGANIASQTSYPKARVGSGRNGAGRKLPAKTP
jgi:hypothetical protein